MSDSNPNPHTIPLIFFQFFHRKDHGPAPTPVQARYSLAHLHEGHVGRHTSQNMTSSLAEGGPFKRCTCNSTACPCPGQRPQGILDTGILVQPLCSR